MSFELALLIKSTLILVCPLLATAVMRRSSASTRHTAWTTALLCLLALPAVSFYFPKSLQLEVAVLPEPQVSDGAFPAATQQAAPTEPVIAPAIPASERQMPTSAPVDSSWRVWLLFGWIAGVAIVLLRTVLAMIATRAMAARSATAMDPEWVSLMTHLRQELDVKQLVDLRIGGDFSPMTWGWRHPVILLPSIANSWTNERRRVVLTHELAHVKRRDGMTQILVQLACSLYWFNPMVWFAERRMRTERERACDDYVLNLGVGAAPYADHLLDIATGSQPGTVLATVSMAQPSQLEIRLRAILNPDLRRGRLSRGTAAILLSCIFALVISLASVHVTTLLSLPLPATTAPSVPVFQTPNSSVVNGPGLPAQANPALPVRQPPETPQATEVLTDLPKDAQDLAAYLEAPAAKRGIAGVIQGTVPTSTLAPQSASGNRTVALVVVLDHSGSMAGTKMDLAKEGAKAALFLLRENDMFGVLTFDYSFQWALAITEARNKEAMQEAINRIYAVGNTNIHPALREAFQRLQATTADTKHIILVSDGQTPAANFQDLVSEILINKITVSTVSVTAASDQKLMSDIAMWGQGRAYYVGTADRLPQIFKDEVSLLVGKVQ